MTVLRSDDNAPKTSWLAPSGTLIAVIAVTLSIFQLWQPLVGFFPAGTVPFEHLLGLQPATYFRPTHLSWMICLGILVYPLKPTLFGRYTRLMDVTLIMLVLWATSRVLAFNYQAIDHLLYGLSTKDFVAGVILLISTLEVARRSVGTVMMILGICFLLYGVYGYLLPDVVASRGFSFERIVRFQVFTSAGLYGAPIGIAAGAVFSFVLFGAFLQITGAGKFLIDLSFAAAGRYRGGPAKASVIASAAMGSISGSAIANTVTTGSLTIPMMKQLGYKPEQAAGIEAAASTGGQIMPPIMGAGAFVMAEFTKTPYGDIVWMSLVPAILYFTSVLLYVHLMAVKGGFTVMRGQTKAWQVVKDGFHFLLPILLITALLLQNYSPVLVGLSGSAAVIVASILRKHTRIGLASISKGMSQGAIMAVPISLACAVAGIVVGTIGQTGIGLQFTESVVSLSSGHLWLALFLVAIAALILGMGLPATAAYIVLSIMTGPALQEMGLALITAHMIIFWLSQTSNVTPPIALAAFAGAGIAGASPMRSAFEAFKLANGLFVIPLMMAYSSLLLVADNNWQSVILSGLLTLVLIVTIAAIVESYLFTSVTRMWRIIGAISAPLILVPIDWLRIAGVLSCSILIIHNYILSRR